MDSLQDRVCNEYACYVSILSATSFLTRHIRVITQETSRISTLYAQVHIGNSRNLCLKKTHCKVCYPHGGNYDH
jgi:hypothetical protein